MTDDSLSDPAPAHGSPARARVITGQVALSRRTPAVVRPAQTVSMRQGEVSGRIALNPNRERIAAVKAMLRAQDHAAAEQALQALLADHPTSVAVRQLQAQLHFLRQRWEEAEAIWRTLVAERPDEPHLRHDHAAALSRLRRFGPARDAFRALLQRWPDFLLARLNLGALLRQEFQRPSEALEVMEQALAGHGDHPPLHFNIGRARQDLLDTAGAIGAYRQALEHDPGHLKAFSAHMFCSHYLPTPDLAALRDWAERHGQTLRRPPTPAGDRVHRPPGPRLRVGLLSGDLSDHPVAYFLESVLRALHGRGVELVAYATHDNADAVTRRLRRSVTTWRLAEALTDAELARQIADDRLDVLLDLAGFTNHSRLGVLLMRPAPLQVSWLGYFGTQGVPEIDAVVADPHCVPADEQRFFTERLLYMPHTRLCMSPPLDAPEPAPEPPLASGAALRFACLQNLHKINARVLDAWRRILLGAPGATLLIQGRQIGQGDVRARFEALLDASGIDRSRVRLRKRIPRGAYLAQYAEVDVLLDTFPYPGGTTTAEAIWMGVPTLTLATPGMLGRQGQALLHQVGLDAWVTHSDDDYVRRAIALANDREGTLATLRQLRRTLRETARHSPLFDAETFARDFEALLRRACAEGVAATAGLPAASAPITPSAAPAAPTLADKQRQVAHFNALMDAGDLDAAEPALVALLAQDPGVVALRQALAALRSRQGRQAEAEALWAELVHAGPDDPHNLHGHAVALGRLARYAEARERLAEAVRRWPGFLPARLQLATLLRHPLRRPGESLALLTPALATHGGHADLHFGIGRSHHDLLDIDQALASYRQAMVLAPDSVAAYCTLAFCSHYLPAPDLDALRRWLQTHGPALHRAKAALERPRPYLADRPLRVGLLSGDFKDHPVSYFAESVMGALRRRGVELVAYATDDQTEADATTARLRGGVSAWREAGSLTDLDLARQIASDGLDVLLDLAGFTHHSRLGVLLMRPAPLQVSWLGYFGTQGVPEIDAVVADPHCVPADEQRFFTERLLHMPHTRLCMGPPANAPEPAPEPPLANGAALRFACVQDLKKINNRVLGAWRRILDGAPDATLLIRCLQTGQSDVRAAFEARLAGSGIDLSRVELLRPRPRGDFLAGLGDIDLLLDTFPYPGGTTTAEAIWMGVPTLTLATPGMLGRQGQALLHQVGLDDWVTHSDDDYVRRAIALANDREGTLATLRHLRRTLRETARRSPLFDAETFAHDFEALLRRACAARAAGAPP